jgi:AcrR family transcriptional regulator
MAEEPPAQPNTGRAHRILDAAGELLLSWGYKRVTVEDVAHRAGVGKGTVYLHWRTKNDLFAALLMREGAAVLAEQLEAMRADPAEVTLHRNLRSMFLIVMRRPLARAFYTGDTDLLGKLCTDTKIGLQAQQDKRAMVPQYHTVLRSHGMLRPQGDQRTLSYALHAATAGFFLLERAPFTDEGLSLEDKADALAATIRNAFEPTEPPSAAQLAAAAPEVIALYKQLLADLTRHLPNEDRTDITA